MEIIKKENWVNEFWLGNFNWKSKLDYNSIIWQLKLNLINQLNGCWGV